MTWVAAPPPLPQQGCSLPRHSPHHPGRMSSVSPPSHRTSSSSSSLSPPPPPPPLSRCHHLRFYSRPRHLNPLNLRHSPHRFQNFLRPSSASRRLREKIKSVKCFKIEDLTPTHRYQHILSQVKKTALPIRIQLLCHHSFSKISFRDKTSFVFKCQEENFFRNCGILLIHIPNRIEKNQ